MPREGTSDRGHRNPVTGIAENAVSAQPVIVSACESAVVSPEARQECQRLGRSDSPFWGRKRPRRRKSRWTRRSESRRREPPNSPTEDLGRKPSLRIGNTRGVGARSQCDERQKSVGRILCRRHWGVARRANRRRPSRKETIATLTRAVAGKRRIGAQASSGIIST